MFLETVHGANTGASLLYIIVNTQGSCVSSNVKKCVCALRLASRALIVLSCLGPPSQPLLLPSLILLLSLLLLRLFATSPSNALGRGPSRQVAGV